METANNAIVTNGVDTGRKIHVRPSLREQQKELTRERLIKAAVEVFDEKGYQSSTIEDITNRANVSRTTFYLHFNTKSEVAIANGDQLVNRIAKLFPILVETKNVDMTVANDFLEAVVTILQDRAQENVVAFQANVVDPELTRKGWIDYQRLGQELLTAFLSHGWKQIDSRASTHLAILIPTIQYALWGQGIFGLALPNEQFMETLSLNVVDAVARAVAPADDSMRR